jgi:two-component system sensor histidine kinase PilS (NtrC family)
VNRLMVNDMQDGVMLVRANGVVVAANPAALVLLGVQPHERIRRAGAAWASARTCCSTCAHAASATADGNAARLDPRKDDVPRILQLLPLPSRPRRNPLLHARLRLRFVLPGLAGLRSTLAGAGSSPIGPTLSAGTTCRPRAPRGCAWPSRRTRRWPGAEDEALLRSEMRDTVLVHIESWGALPSRCSRKTRRDGPAGGQRGAPDPQPAGRDQPGQRAAGRFRRRRGQYRRAPAVISDNVRGSTR